MLVFQAGEVGVVNIAGNVAAVEHRAVEILRQAVFGTGAGVDEVGQGLIDHAVGANRGGDVCFFAAVGDELVVRRHVDAVNVREAHRRRGAGEIDFLRACIARHLDNLLAGGAAHDGVIHQQHVFVAKFQRHRVQLLPHRLLAQLLPRHDEGAADIAVLHKTLAVFHAKARRQLNRRAAAGVRDGDDDVNIMRRPVAQNALGELLAHAQARLVHIDSVDGRIRAGEIDVLENARHAARAFGALLVMHLAAGGDNERLAGL